jgi:methyl-accepting chemotaxis protein
MDQVTQQNAAMVEQTTAATHSLKGQTLELVKQVSAFSISTRQKAVAPVISTRAPSMERPVARPISRPGAVSRGNAAVAIKEEWEEF